MGSFGRLPSRVEWHCQAAILPVHCQPGFAARNLPLFV
jgi:hypothetical protein